MLIALSEEELVHSTLIVVRDVFLLANIIGILVCCRHLCKVVVDLFPNQVLCFEDSFIGGVEELDEHEDAAWGVEQRVVGGLGRAMW